MSTGWHHARDGEQLGPVSFDEMRQRASTGLLREDDLVWCEGMSVWEPASRIAGLFPRRATEWYYSQGGERFGPVSDVDLKGLAAAGRLQPSDLVWTEGQPEWKSAGEVPGIFHGSPSVEGASQPKGVIRRVKEYATSDEAKAMLERMHHAASSIGDKMKDAAVEVGGKVEVAAKKARDYAGSDDEKNKFDPKEVKGLAKVKFATLSVSLLLFLLP